MMIEPTMKQAFFEAEKAVARELEFARSQNSERYLALYGAGHNNLNLVSVFGHYVLLHKKDHNIKEAVTLAFNELALNPLLRKAPVSRYWKDLFKKYILALKNAFIMHELDFPLIDIEKLTSQSDSPCR